MTIKSQLEEDFLAVLKGLNLPQKGVFFERPRDPKNGDYSTNWALQQAKIKTGEIKQSLVEIAKKIAKNFPQKDYLKKVEAITPGFINLFLTDDFWQQKVGEIVLKKENFAKVDTNKNKSARVEFVSANPTGPLHIGNARGGPLGDTLANVLALSGYKVFREYYHNDIGGQVQKFATSLWEKISGKNLDGEYKGKYLKELAVKVRREKDSKKAVEKALEILLSENLTVCKKMGISFDKIYKESEYVPKTRQVIKKLEKFSKKEEGALWFAPKDEFLKDRECVLVKSNGELTYFANDITYHSEKFEENSDLVVDVLGSNHHGHEKRMRAALASLGFDVSKFSVILYQFVRVKRGNEILKMSKRAGTFITAQEVLDEVGADAFRFFLLMYDPNTHMDFDLNLAKERSEKNPVYYVQYAHARISSILKKADSGRLTVSTSRADYSRLKTTYEIDLIKQLTRLPELVEEVARDFAVQKIAFYAMSLADSFHQFYENCKVLTEDRELSEARLQLVLATKIVLKSTLGILGVSAPEKM